MFDVWYVPSNKQTQVAVTSVKIDIYIYVYVIFIDTNHLKDLTLLEPCAKTSAIEKAAELEFFEN